MVLDNLNELITQQIDEVGKYLEKYDVQFASCIPDKEDRIKCEQLIDFTKRLIQLKMRK